MEIQLPIFKHFKYSGKKKKTKQNKKKKNRTVTINLRNTKKKSSLANGFFYSSRDSIPAFVCSALMRKSESNYISGP